MTKLVSPHEDALTNLHARTMTAHASADDWLALGRMLLTRVGRDQHRRREALSVLVRAYQLDPSADPSLPRTIAQTAVSVRDWDLAVSATGLMLTRNTGDVDALGWRAAALYMRQEPDFEQAMQLLHEAARIQPDTPLILIKLALCLKEQGRFSETETVLRHVLELSPNSARALVDLSDLEIRRGDYLNGWAHYEAQYRLEIEPNAPLQALAAISKCWQGESLASKTLVVYADLGNGDCLWAVRFLPLLAERARREGGRVIIGIDGPLRRLFERTLPDDVTLETSLITHPDLYCGLIKLPLRLGISEQSDWRQPYLSADAEKANLWRTRVAQTVTTGQRKVGVVWNGDPINFRDTLRSVPVDQFESLLTVPGITYFVLSPGRSHTVAQWRRNGIDVVDLTEYFDNGFDDVAALMVNLDLVVTIESAPAHLAGALGVPTCLMLDHVSAWFWASDGDTHAPWYKSIEMYRQTEIRVWEPVLAHVRERLEALAVPRHCANPEQFNT